ncbi:hypothetical protein Tco_1438828 [Tanacetum coccineum]
MKDVSHTIVQATQVIDDTHVIMTVVTPKVEQQSSSTSSGFVSNMLNPKPDTGIDSILNQVTELMSLIDVPVTTNDEIPSSFATILPPPPYPLILPLQQTPFSSSTILSGSSLLDLPTFGSVFWFDERVRSLENNFSKSKQSNQFAEAVSLIPSIVDKLREEAQAVNQDFINKIDENMKKIVKEQVKKQVNEQISKILLRIEKSVNDKLKAEILIHYFNAPETSHAVAATLSELELKKILIDKMKHNKSINKSVQQENLYKALVDAYETDKEILDPYGDAVTFRRCRDDEDEDEEPSTRSNRGSKRRKTGKEPESTSALKDKPSKSTGLPKEGSKSKTRSTGTFSLVEEQVHTVKDVEKLADQEFKTGFTEVQPHHETSQPLDWFHKPAKPPTPDLDWNNTFLGNHGPIQPWINTLAWKQDPRKSFNELKDTPLDFSAFMLNRLEVDTLTLELLAGPTSE